MNAAENGVRELKKDLARQSDAKEAFAHEIMGQLFGASRSCHVQRGRQPLWPVNGETQETTISGETANKSEFTKCGWCNRIKFRSGTVPHPEGKLVLGRCFRPAKHRHWSVDEADALLNKVNGNTL
jgi:hypothetical protein